MKPQLLLMDISNADNTSGVDRYMEVLTEGLATQTEWEVVRLHFVHDNALIAHRRIDHREKKYTEIRLPMPEISDPMIGQQFWAEKFYQTAMEILEGYGLGPDIRLIHLHTLNLIDLATLIKQKYHCPIITHLHCIPWNWIHNIDKKTFSLLYEAYYYKANAPASLFLTNNGNEIRAYTQADHIICLTQCAKEFVQRVASLPDTSFSLIRNGIPSLSGEEKPHNIVSKACNLLYVGQLSAGKGFDDLLASLERLRKKGYALNLTAAGFVSEEKRNQIKKQYPYLSLHMPGVVDKQTLQKYYQEADIGIFLSFLEQSSYAAIEMARAQLPMIVSAMEGLDEMFEDGVNALKVSILFDRYRGLRINENLLDKTIIQLLDNEPLRRKLSSNVYRLYRCNHTAERMWQETWAVYHQLLNTNQA